MFKILENQAIARDIFRLVVEGDHGFTRPGQFAGIAVPGFFLRRPISVCDFAPGFATYLYRTVGPGTHALSRMQIGDTLDMLSPLGNGFDVDKSAETPLLVGGGVGVPPLYALAKHLVQRGKQPQVVLGFATQADAFLVDDFRALACDVHVATLDGSLGMTGMVTDAMAGFSTEYAFACGPEAMMKAIYERVTDGQFSLEARMACGYGACMGCTCKTQFGKLQLCVDGPVLAKGVILW